MTNGGRHPVRFKKVKGKEENTVIVASSVTPIVAMLVLDFLKEYPKEKSKRSRYIYTTTFLENHSENTAEELELCAIIVADIQDEQSKSEERANLMIEALLDLMLTAFNHRIKEISEV